jgi:hypothetical protein
MQAIYLGGDAMKPDFSMDRKHISEVIGDGSFKPLRHVGKPYLTGWLGRKKEIEAKVEALMLEQLHADELRGADLVSKAVICKYVENTLKYDISLLGDGDLFEIVQLEAPKECGFNGFKFFGYIDRIDRILRKEGGTFKEGPTRIIDYKTGAVDPKEKDINANVDAVGAKLFSMKPSSDKPSKPLQFFIYDLFVSNDETLKGKEVVNEIYHPVDILLRHPNEEKPSPEFVKMMTAGLTDTLDEIVRGGQKFDMTDDVNSCKNCDFKNICGR